MGFTFNYHIIEEQAGWAGLVLDGPRNGFPSLAHRLYKEDKSLVFFWAFTRSGNPQLRDLFDVFENIKDSVRII